MKIYFTASTAEFDQNKKNYIAIRDFLVKEKHILTRDWLYEANRRIQSKLLEQKDIKEIYKLCIKGIDDADLVIVEDTVSNFSTGHQITIALLRQKPTLVLWNRPKHKHFKKMFIHGIESDLLEVKMYNQQNLFEIIRTFVNKYKNASERKRFHLVLTGFERDYLDWLHFNLGLSRTELIKSMINESLSKNIEYKKYLRN